MSDDNGLGFCLLCMIVLALLILGCGACAVSWGDVFIMVTQAIWGW